MEKYVRLTFRMERTTEVIGKVETDLDGIQLEESLFATHEWMKTFFGDDEAEYWELDEVEEITKEDKEITLPRLPCLYCTCQILQKSINAVFYLIFCVKKSALCRIIETRMFTEFNFPLKLCKKKQVSTAKEL